MYLASNIKFLRKQKGYTQDEVASLLGVMQCTVANWEKGMREPDVQKIMQIARLFSVSLDDLFLKEIVPQKPLYIENLIWLRKSKGLTQEYVTRCLGYSDEFAISKIESCGSKLSIENLIQLANFYEVSLDDLVQKELSVEVI